MCSARRWPSATWTATATATSSSACPAEDHHSGGRRGRVLAYGRRRADPSRPGAGCSTAPTSDRRVGGSGASWGRPVAPIYLADGTRQPPWGMRRTGRGTQGYGRRATAVPAWVRQAVRRCRPTEPVLVPDGREAGSHGKETGPGRRWARGPREVAGRRSTPPPVRCRADIETGHGLGPIALEGPPVRGLGGPRATEDLSHVRRVLVVGLLLVLAAGGRGRPRTP